jgi:hypothetical protein
MAPPPGGPGSGNTGAAEHCGPGVRCCLVSQRPLTLAVRTALLGALEIGGISAKPNRYGDAYDAEAVDQLRDTDAAAAPEMTSVPTGPNSVPDDHRNGLEERAVRGNHRTDESGSWRAIFRGSELTPARKGMATVATKTVATQPTKKGERCDGERSAHCPCAPSGSRPGRSLPRCLSGHVEQDRCRRAAMPRRNKCRRA